MNDLVQRPAPALALGDSLMRLIADPNITADKLNILLTMQRELIAENRVEAFQSAYAAMAIEIPQVDKNGIVELIKDGKVLGRYNFAKFDDMDTVMRPIMHRFGFGIMFVGRIEAGKQVLTGRLMHAAGHFVI